MSVPLRSEVTVAYATPSDAIDGLCDELNRTIAEDKSLGKGLYSDLYHLPNIPRSEEKEFVSRAVNQFNLWIEDPKKASDALSALKGTIYENCRTLTKERAGDWKIAMKVKLYRNWKKALKNQHKSKKK